MTDDTIRLSDFVPMHAKFHSIAPKLAAYDLSEWMQRLKGHYCDKKGQLMPRTLFWLGGAITPDRSEKHLEMDYGALIQYFQAWGNTPTDDEPSFRGLIQGRITDVPACTVFTSRKALIEWVQFAWIKCPSFLIQQPEHTEAEIKAFQAKELVYISRLTQGLLKLVLEVDKAHRGPHHEKDRFERAEKIKSRIAKIDLKKSPHNWMSALFRAAEAAGIEEIPKGEGTLRKYMNTQ